MNMQRTVRGSADFMKLSWCVMAQNPNLKSITERLLYSR
jgi:hypothetical protein